MANGAEGTLATPEAPRYARPTRKSLGRGFALAALATLVIAAPLVIPRGWLEGLAPSAGGPEMFFRVEPRTLTVTLTEDGELKPRESIKVQSQVEGQSTILSIVDESAKVKKGDLLVELASDQLVERIEGEEIELAKLEANAKAAKEDLDIQRNQNASDIRKAEIDLEVAQLELKKYLEGDYEQTARSIEIDIQQTRTEIDRKGDELEKNTRLKEKGFVTQIKLDELAFELFKAEKTLEKHLLAKQILLDYDRPKNEMQLRSAVDRAREELERARKRAASTETQKLAQVEQNDALLRMRQGRLARMKSQLAACKIYAPAEGVVQYPDDGSRWGDDRIGPGQSVREGQTIIVLPDTSQMLVSARVHEADRHRIAVGLKVRVRVPAVPGATFTGEIAKIDKFADSTNRWLNPELKEHQIEVLLDAFDAPISPGDTAELEILIDELRDVLSVPVQCVYSRGGKSFVFAGDGADLAPVEVDLGQSTATVVEVKRGLHAGQRVAMRADARMLAKLPPDELLEQPPQIAGPQRPRIEAPAASEPPRKGPGAGRRGGPTRGAAGGRPKSKPAGD